MKRILLSICIIAFVNIGFAQEENKEEHEHASKHLVAAAFGYTYIPSAGDVGSEEAGGVFVPSIGLDYFYSLSSKWKIGIMNDWELGEYILFHKELHRENVFITAAVAGYSLTKSINLLAGGGIEFEEKENLAVLRFGTEYELKLPREFVISPGFFYDLKEGVDTWVLSIAIGKEF